MNAMMVLLDKYGILIRHLKQMSEDKTYKTQDRAKFSEYLRKWENARYPVLLCLFIELLSPVKILSLAFQDEDFDIVNVLSAIEKTKKQLDKLIEHDFQKYPTFLRFKSKCFEEEKVLYEGAGLKLLDTAEKNAITQKNQLTGLIRDHILKRFEETEIDTLKSATILLNTEAWQNDDEFGIGDIRKIFDHFRVPLQQAGVGGLEDVLEEWRDLVQYAVTYLNVETLSYPELWYRIFNSSRKSNWSKVLIIAELLFCFPISNAVVERLFSLLKCIKTKQRTVPHHGRLENIIGRLNETPK